MTFFVIIFPGVCILSPSQSEVDRILSENSNAKVVAFCTWEEAYNYVRELGKLFDENVCIPNDVYTVDIVSEYKSNAYNWKARIEDSCQKIELLVGEKSFENEAYCVIEGMLVVSSRYKEKDLRFQVHNEQIVNLFNNFREKRKITIPSHIGRIFEKLASRNITLSISKS